jgi:hypothetical protein
MRPARIRNVERMVEPRFVEARTTETAFPSAIDHPQQPVREFCAQSVQRLAGARGQIGDSRRDKTSCKVPRKRHFPRASLRCFQMGGAFDLAWPVHRNRAH